MDVLALVILASLIGAILVARVILSATNRAAEGAITRYFKAGEHIVNTGAPPPDWLDAPLKRRLLRAGGSVSQDDLLSRLDDLIHFFESCSFFEDERAREQLLSQLNDARGAWQQRHI